MAKKILVVDDEPDILKVVRFRLKATGYDVITAENGQKALDLMEKQKPDLIFVDLRMPVLDGYGLCRRLKADDELKNIPIVLLSASSGGTIAEKAEELKADDYLVKPFEPEELLEKVKKFLGEKK